MDADILIIGAGLAGLVAAHEAVARGRRVIIVDQEGPQNLGGIYNNMDLLVNTSEAGEEDNISHAGSQGSIYSNLSKNT